MARKKIELRIKKLVPEAQIPAPAHEGDACVDLFATSVKYDKEKDEYVYGTGIACETTETCMWRLCARSSIHKTNFYLTNGIGVIDTQTYRGEVMAIFKHRDSLETRLHRMALVEWDKLPWYQKIKQGSLVDIVECLREDFFKDPLKWAPYNVGDAICQGELVEIQPVTYTEVEELTDTERGDGGFGSSKNAKFNK